MRRTCSGIFSLILLLASPSAILAQDVYETTLASDENHPIALVVRGPKRVAFLTTGQKLYVQVTNSKAREYGTITSITDTTITIQHKAGDFRVIPIRSLSFIKIPRSMVRKVGGVLLLGVAVGLAIGASQFISEQALGDSSVSGVMITVFVIIADIVAVAAPIGVGIGAAAMFKARKFHIGPSKINATRAVIPGNLIRLVLKNGEVIEKLQVRRIKEGQIFGQEQWIDPAGLPATRDRRISFVDIGECSRER